MQNKGYVFMSVFALIVFLLVCHGCYLKLGDAHEQ